MSKAIFRVVYRGKIYTDATIENGDTVVIHNHRGNIYTGGNRCKIEFSTGFKDKTGKEIFAGDILSDWTDTEEGLRQSFVQVFWCGKTGAWKLDCSYKQDKSSSNLLSIELADFDYEVTGNIHENSIANQLWKKQ